MRYPIGFTMAQARHRTKMERTGNKRYPTVLMLEPLYTCNLACLGCSVERHTGKLKDRMSLETCFKAVEDSGAPIINICGGEPTLYPELKELIEGLIARGKYIILCTNAIKMEEKIFGVIPPSPNLFIMVHLDGMRETHDFVVNRQGIFDKAVEAIKKGRELGYYVFINTTVYKETDVQELEDMFKFLSSLEVDGHTISPGYDYDAAKKDMVKRLGKDPKEFFLTRDMTRKKFAKIEEWGRLFTIFGTPVYQEFLAGKRELTCTAWAIPTYNVKGWKGPCYLITDAHYETFEELMTKTPWENYGHGNDPRCENCMVHCGYEPSAAYGINAKLSDPFKTLSWLLG